MATPDSLSVNALFSVAGKIAVVTGGSRGIGEMIAAGLLANGAKVYISSRKADQCDATAARLSAEYGGECISIPADLSIMEGITALASAIGERESRVDILVNNAGVSWALPSKNSQKRVGTKYSTPTSKACSSSPSIYSRCSRLVPPMTTRLASSTLDRSTASEHQFSIPIRTAHQRQLFTPSLARWRPNS